MGLPKSGCANSYTKTLIATVRNRKRLSVIFTERGGMHVIPIETLIELKLASGMSAPHRLRDLADVQDLITTLKLPIEFVDRLDFSVQETFKNLWKSAKSDSENENG